MKTVIIVQARTGSTRLPGKVLMPLAGKPLLQRQLERMLRVTADCEIVIATTNDSADDEVRRIGREIGVKCYDGHPTDLLDRHYRVALAEGADTVVKIPSDCPLIDPAIIDRVLSTWSLDHERFDFLSNLHPATYPDGNDVEVMPFQILEIAWKEATEDFEREHTTPFIWERPERFRIGNVEWETGLNYSMSHRWTIDYPEDYDFIRIVYDELWTSSKPVFSLGDILELLDRNPELARMNEQHAGVNWYRHHMAQLRTISAAEIRSHS